MIYSFGMISKTIYGLRILKGSRNATTISSLDRLSGDTIDLIGIIASVANPYLWIWWLSIISPFALDRLKRWPNPRKILASMFMIGHLSADFWWYTMVSPSLDMGRAAISEESYRRMIALCCDLLILFELYYLSRLPHLSCLIYTATHSRLYHGLESILGLLILLATSRSFYP